MSPDEAISSIKAAEVEFTSVVDLQNPQKLSSLRDGILNSDTSTSSTEDLQVSFLNSKVKKSFSKNSLTKGSLPSSNSAQ